MKINPIGLQSYQDLIKRQETPAETGQKQATNETQPTSIKPQAAETRSRMAVAAPAASYADNLTADEKRALELVFNRFRDAGRIGAAGSGDADEQPNVGGLLDVKA